MISGHVFPSALRPIRSTTISSRRVYSTIPDGRSNQASYLSTNVRTLMRSTPHPLTAIVSYSSQRSKLGDQSDKEPCGLLVSSFNTVTIYPTPYVSFNIKRPSSTYDAILESGSFIASGLTSASVADAFATSNGPAKPWKQLLGSDGKLKEGKGATWWMLCRLVEHKSVEIEDHTVVIGKVLEAAPYDNGQIGMGLVYAEGKYRGLGEVVRPSHGEEN